MNRRSRGFTLIELVISIVILSTVAVTLIGLLAFVTRTSAEGLSQAQAAVIANAYMQEILRQKFSSSDDDIAGYDGQNISGVLDASGAAIVGLENYRVAISVQRLDFGSGANRVPASATAVVTVTVTDPLGEFVTLRGLRTQR